jgi:exopolyphosphatase/guanosine-5'-triphosphate,3'-diphosphate pyrophosphatase
LNNVSSSDSTNYRFGIIDIGSRGIRLLIADVEDTEFKFVYSTGGFSKLGEMADDQGNLSPASIEHVTETVKTYIDTCHSYGTEHLQAIATQVVRNAPNKNMFIDRISAHVPLKILSPEEESTCSFLASVDAFRAYLNSESNLLVIDQGGGSTELAAGGINADGTPVLKHFASYEFGTLELSRILLRSELVNDGLQEIKQLLRTHLLAIPPFELFSQSPPTLVIGMGSSLTSLIKRFKGIKSLRRLHGHSIKKSEIDTLIQQTPGNARVADIQADDELTSIISGILTYQMILSRYQADRVYLSRHGMRYGALLSLAGRPCEQDL